MPEPALSQKGLPPRSFLADLGIIWEQRRRVWQLLSRADKLGFAFGVLITVAVAYIHIQIAVLLGDYLNRVLKLTDRPAALTTFATPALAFLGGYYVLKVSLQWLRCRLISRTTARIESEMTTRLVGHVLRSDLGAWRAERIGALPGPILRSVDGFGRFLKIAFADFIPACATALYALYAGLRIDWRVGLIMLAMVPVSILITIWQVSSEKGVGIHFQRAAEELDGMVVEQLGGIESIRAANTDALEVLRIKAAARWREILAMRYGVAMARFDWLKAINEGAFCVAILGCAIVLAAHGHFGYGQVFTFSMLYLTIVGAIKNVRRIRDEGRESTRQVTKLLELLRQPIDQSFGVVTLRIPQLDGSVPILECQDLVVEDKMPHGNRRILDGVSLSVQRGQTVGIAGRSGSGKSTWLRAVLRLLDVTSGDVLVGGVPIGVLSREDISKSIGYVGSTPFVFSGTVRQNIGYGCGAVSIEQIEDAARLAHIHEEITQMPLSYETMVSERGANLSAGQRQRLAFARMFLKNPPILILEEGVSSVDDINERRVRAAIDHARDTHTVIMVARRLATLNDADCIFVFDLGRVVEQGTFDDLMEKNGTFADLVRNMEPA
jgi:ATP-binding cassette subfamily B protein